MSGDFGIDPQKRVDFAYRAVHLTAMAEAQNRGTPSDRMAVALRL